MIKNMMDRIEKFTIHFATINTIALIMFLPESLPFTIHFATINTKT